MSEYANGAEFRIDPEFQNKIPPIGDDEFKQLRENILSAGEVYEPLVVWDGVLVDGHNRWKVIQENPAIKWRVREMDFADKWAAFEWMYKNQLGRRNLTDEQRTYMIGKMYEARKKTSGGTGANQYTTTKVQDAQNGQAAKVATTDKNKHGVSGELAIELNIGRNTVRRAEKFTKGVDALREVSPEAADKVLNGKVNVAKKDIAKLAESEPDTIESFADAVNAGKKPEKREKKNEGNSAELRQLYKTIDEAYAPMVDADREIVSTIDDLIEEIEINGKNYVNVLRSTMECKRQLIVGDEKKQMVSTAIANIIQEIIKVRGEYVK